MKYLKNYFKYWLILLSRLYTGYVTDNNKISISTKIVCININYYWSHLTLYFFKKGIMDRQTFTWFGG